MIYIKIIYSYNMHKSYTCSHRQRMDAMAPLEDELFIKKREIMLNDRSSCSNLSSSELTVLGLQWFANTTA